MDSTPDKTSAIRALSSDPGKISGPAPSGLKLLNYEKRTMLLLAAKTTLAAGLCYWLAQLAGLKDGYWGSITAIIVMQSNVGSTVTASRDRFIGTLIGAAFGAAFSFLGPGLWVYLLAVLAAMSACSLLGLKNSSRLSGVTVSILMLVHRTSADWIQPLHRVLEVLLGIAVALTVSAVVLPNRARLRLREGLVEEFLLLGKVFEAMMEGFRGHRIPSLSALWKKVEASETGNTQLRDAAHNELPGGEPSFQKLNGLLHFARSIHDALRALELAVEGSEQDSYAGRLDPELATLISHAGRAFQTIADRIRRWEFHAEDGFSLEEDVAALEAKMKAIRPAGVAFSPDEMLRSYAVQLHLKQLARLLRASEIETADATGDAEASEL